MLTKTSSLPVSGLWNGVFMKVLKNIKLILNESLRQDDKGSIWNRLESSDSKNKKLEKLGTFL